ncbi:ComEA family DNA-binding protein, partial [Streptomyces sp. PAL114]|nr:ComEA family DNA-binding protein [Streptomyces sp. PAL114]
MALRSRTRTANPTSGPGRGPLSDGRTRNRHRRPGRVRTWPLHGPRDGDPHAPEDDIRRRAETLFGVEGGG